MTLNIRRYGTAWRLLEIRPVRRVDTFTASWITANRYLTYGMGLKTLRLGEREREREREREIIAAGNTAKLPSF